ncbi:WecB/TagA/CpsF family glycosyltransferase [Brucepastera parasyntrophica]|uniref:WecB/TagA/CpsF family glycosyltransferase n=1 Tax=Brucepastera parasyntrophica TaxID=2880008 RepID=UPI00210CC0D1|nr:WecB/TagA/CpsF family glycosyltransferase [Brucepastera parasyntrophica]ULQ60886.1 WecB/TagA/CpsF family glycosyltransferase [Brucepastera parasyntrophica]
MATERIQFMKVPFDVVPEEDFEQTILDLLAKKGPQHIMLLSLWDFLRARHRGEFHTMVVNAALVLPVSKSLIRGIRFLKKNTPDRYQSFSLIIKVLGILEKHYKSLYLFGAHQRSLLQAEKNVRSTFPNLSIVGRFPGYYHKTMEKNILTAITKAEPSLILAGNGIPGAQRWINRNRLKLNSGLFIWDPDVIDIFSERKRRISEKTFKRGLEYFPQILKNPLRIFRIFQYLWYNILLLCYRLLKRNS